MQRQKGVLRSNATTHRIPAGLSGEPLRSASGVAARRDVIQRALARRVQEGVEETHRRLARRNQAVIEQRDDAREDRSARARPGYRRHRAIDHDLVRDACGGDIGVCTPGLVEQPGVGRTQSREIRRDGVGLVLWRGEEVRETARRQVGSSFRCGTLSGAYYGYATEIAFSRLHYATGKPSGLQGATRRESRPERGTGSAFAVVNAAVSRREEDGSPPRAELRVRVAKVPNSASCQQA